MTAVEHSPDCIYSGRAERCDGSCRTPVRGRSRDGIYPRCVWCDGENYMLAVLAYSAGEVPCAAAGGCGKFLPEDYRGPVGCVGG